MNPTLEEITTSCGQALFAHYGLPVDVEPLDDPSTIALCTFAGLIGFAGEAMKGSLLVSVNADAVSATTPGDVDCDDDFRQDWVGELCNQYLGRMVNKISGYGTTLRMATPVALRGENMSMMEQRDSETAGWRLTAGDATIVVWLAVAVDSAFAWEMPQGAEDVPDEGDLLLF